MEEFEKVKAVIVDQLSVDEDEVTMESSFVDDYSIVTSSSSTHDDSIESSFVDDLGADSLDVVELIMGLETAFDIEIPDEEAEKISTVGDAVEYIKSHS